MGGPHCIVGDDGELFGRHNAQSVCDVVDRARDGVVDDPCPLEGRMGRTIQHEVHRDRQKDGSGRLESCLKVAALQRHCEIVDATHLVSIFCRCPGQFDVRRTKHWIVNEKAQILLTVNDEERHAGHERVAHVEHAVGEAGVGMQTDDGRLACDERISGGNADGARIRAGTRRRWHLTRQLRPETSSRSCPDCRTRTGFHRSQENPE